MWKWIGYGAVAIVGVFVAKKAIDAATEKPFDEGYKHGRAGKPSKVTCSPLDLSEYCKGFLRGVEDRKLAGG